MSLITEYNLSFSDIENCAAPRKPRSIRPQQYVQAAEYEREILTKLPQIAGTAKTTIKDGDAGGVGSDGGLGIKGVGKLHSNNQESVQYNKKERTKRKRKKRARNVSKFNEDLYDSNDDIYQSCAPSLLPSIEAKPFTCTNKANFTDKAGKTMTELADYFRCYHGTYNDKMNQSDHDRHKYKNYKKSVNADVLLAEAIQKDKNQQKQASKQLHSSVVRGRGMEHTCLHH